MRGALSRINAVLSRLGKRHGASPQRQGMRLSAEEQKHVLVDDEGATIYLDATKQGDQIYLLFLDWHARNTARLYDVVWEPFADLNHRRDQVRRRATVIHSKAGTETATAKSAKGKAEELIRLGARMGASDIHILRREAHTEIQVRIKKNLLVLNDLSAAEGDALIVAIYRLGSSQDSTLKELETQDGGISGHVLDGTGLENVRIVRGPAYPAMNGGGHMELRLQYREKSSGAVTTPPGVVLRKPRIPPGQLMLKDYGFDDDQIDKLLYIASAPSGLLLLTGPTGSGKTTTIFEIAKWQARTSPNKRTVTIEQPVEYPMSWAIQLEISNALTGEEAGARFKENLRYSLRMDPDRLIIGEIRDAEVALTSFDASQTGHSVLSTLHIEDPFDFPLRFQNMNYERLSYRVTCNSTVIRGIVAQRLVPVLCEHCKLPWQQHDERMPRLARHALASWGDTSTIFMRNDDGCSRCQHTGMTAVTAVAEVVRTDEELMNDFIHHGVATARRRYRGRPDADISMVERAIRLAFAGRVDPVSIIAEVAEIPFKDQITLDRRRGAAERERAHQDAERFLQDEASR